MIKIEESFVVIQRVLVSGFETNTNTGRLRFFNLLPSA
jgi:hypothetical protein